jgi:hypothetical protein
MDNVDAFILVVAVLAGLGSVAAARNWPGGRWASDLWQRLEPYAGCYVRRSPATFVYVGIIFVTTWVVAGVTPAESEALLRSQSTNLDNLGADPVTVLFRSAFWSGGTAVVAVIVLLAAVLAPAEVWLGTARLIFVFAVGHVTTTLITAIAISQGYFGAPGRYGIARTVDVGVSYGLLCVAAVLTHRLPRPWRLLSSGGMLLMLSVFAFVVGRTFTDFGHLVAALTGFAIYPLIHSHSVDQRAQIPLYRPWLQPRQRVETPP